MHWHTGSSPCWRPCPLLHPPAEVAAVMSIETISKLQSVRANSSTTAKTGGKPGQLENARDRDNTTAKTGAKPGQLKNARDWENAKRETSLQEADSEIGRSMPKQLPNCKRLPKATVPESKSNRPLLLLAYRFIREESQSTFHIPLISRPNVSHCPLFRLTKQRGTSL